MCKQITEICLYLITCDQLLFDKHITESILIVIINSEARWHSG